MKAILCKIPQALIFSRLIASVLILALAFSKAGASYIVALAVYALLSDIFDGVIARKLGVATAELRVMDTKTDTVFWFSCLFALCVLRHHFLSAHAIQTGILVFSELACIAAGMLRFHARISFHTLLSKLWALALLWFFIEAMNGTHAELSFRVAFWYGLLAQGEIMLIALVLKENKTDVLTLFHAWRLNKANK